MTDITLIGWRDGTGYLRADSTRGIEWMIGHMQFGSVFPTSYLLRGLKQAERDGLATDSDVPLVTRRIIRPR